jgi:predicted DCC family thiol-disulfide oxidoreductase YuxK
MDPLLVFDGDCGFCSTVVRFTIRRVRPGLEADPWQRSDLADLGLTETACREAVQYRDRAGAWHAGAAAVVMLLQEGDRPWSSLGRVSSWRGVIQLLEFAYRWVAGHRHRLPGGTPACQLPEP